MFFKPLDKSQMLRELALSQRGCEGAVRAEQRERAALTHGEAAEAISVPGWDPGEARSDAQRGKCSLCAGLETSDFPTAKFSTVLLA